MAQTFTQKSMQQVQLEDLTPEQFMDIALRTSKTLGWVVARQSETSFTAYTDNGIFNWNAEVQLNMYNDTAHIISQSHSIRSIEKGKDEMNINNFMSRFNQIKESVSAIELDEVYLALRSQVA